MGHEAAVLESIEGEALTLEGVEAKGKVDGLLFELAVEQRYRNALATNVEAVYTFPLPLDAVLLDLEIRLNGKTLVGVVAEKREAEEKYEEAIDQGDTAIMLERAGDGLCTVNLGNLMAGESATIRYRYAELLCFEHGSVRLTILTVIAPRYGDPATGRLQPHQTPHTDLAVEYPFGLTLELRGAIAGGTITSPSHAIGTARTADGVAVTLARKACLDRDFVLSVSGLAGQSLATLARDGDGYVALASFCADVPRAAGELPLRLKLVVDCSGSMGGDSIEAAKRALHRILAGLTPADRFSYSRFGSNVIHDIDRLVPADSSAIRKAAACLAHTDADLGGTEMEQALVSVFAMGGADGAADVLLVTDGEIFGVDSLVAAAKRAGQRVFVVAIGSAPAEGVLRRIAEATGGACDFVAPNEDAEAAILRMFARLRAPRVKSAAITWPMTPKWVTPLPQGLFGGETIHVYAGFDTLPAGEVALRLVPTGAQLPLETRTALPAFVLADTTPARMAAARRIEAADAKRRLALALQYSLLTDQTNFIVVHERAEDEKARDLPELREVAQMHAAGWGGMGSVREGLAAHVALKCSYSMDHCEDLDYCPTFNHSESPPDSDFGPESDFGSRPGVEPVPEPADAEPAETRLRLPIDHLMRRISRFAPKFFWGVTLPATLDEVARLGLGMFDELIAELRTLVVAGHAERDVVRAFLAALAPIAVRTGASRQLVRTLRNQFKTPDEQSTLRAEVSAILARWESEQVPA